MREIKFRVWNKNRKMFIIDGMTPKEIQDDATQSMELPMMTSEDCVWQQCTGLKDENGVEIYEGDIISVTSEEFGECLPEFEHLEYKSQEHFEWITVTRNAEVLYEADGWGGFKIRYLDWYYSLLNHSSTSNPKLVEGFVNNKDGVVVGNIFEGVDK